MNEVKVNFVIPVRHYKSVRDWEEVKVNLDRTLKSISGQVGDNWHCFIICNAGTELPNSSANPKITVIEKEFVFFELPPKTDNPDYYHDLIRMDKGLRVYEALKMCDENDFFMVVDYDDFIHRDLSIYVNEHRVSNSSLVNPAGWLISEGFIYSGGCVALLNKRFDEICGTSNIVSVSFLKQFYDSNGTLPVKFIKELLGSHRFIKIYMNATGSAYNKLPFPGAVYNVGIVNSSSQSVSVLKGLFSLNKILNTPRTMLKLWLSLRLFSKKSRRLFNIDF